jgi:16S rRNA (guanine527-N7)-methyltransferase
VNPDGVLDRWLEEVVSTPGLTGIKTADEARGILLDDALRARSLVEANDGPVVDVGSGGGSPGLPLAVVLPERRFTLLEAERRKAEALVRLARDLPNVEVVWGRAETQAVDLYGVALAKALAKPPVAAELTLPLVRPGGVAVLWVGATADRAHVGRVAAQLSAELEAESDDAGLLVLRKLAPTPEGFPRRPGMAKKRPLR